MADKKKDEAVYLPTTATLDMERRLDEENLTPEELAEKYGTEARVYAVEDNDTSAYVGVNPEYMTYANETEKPLAAEDGPWAEAEERQLQTAYVAESVSTESNQTQGGGSSVPLIFPELSGEDYENQVISAEDLAKETERLRPDEQGQLKPAHVPADALRASQPTTTTASVKPAAKTATRPQSDQKSS